MISYHHHYETDEDYSYDSNGNRTNTGYATDPYNRLTSDGTFRYEYDAEGNRTLRFDDDGDDVLDSGDTDITGYTWDHRNRLASVEHFDTYADYYADSPDKVVEYAYDSMDQLLRRREDTDGNGSVDEVAKYVYDGGRLALEFDSEDELTHRYLCNEAIDQVLADEPAVGDLLWALSDHEGTVRDLIDSDRNIDGHRNFDAFGKMTPDPGAADCLFAFAGQYLDEATGLQLHGVRWYDPPVGRFASEDPSGLAPDSNPYRYAGNSPLVNVDPSGLCYQGFSYTGFQLATPVNWGYATTGVATASRGVRPGLGLLAGDPFPGYSTSLPAYEYGSQPVPSPTVTDIAGLTRLVAATRFNGDVGQASAHMDQYITDLAFVMKNPTLGTYPGLRGSLNLFTGEVTPNAQIAFFSDQITEADREAARARAIYLLPGVLTGEHPNDPLRDATNRIFGQYRELLERQQRQGMLNSVDALALEDLKNGANGFCNAYRRATMGETKLGQFALFLGQPDTQNAFFGMFSGFAGVAESGQRVGKVEPEMYARVTEPGARSEQIATLVISASRNPALAENIRHAQMAGHPDVLTYGGNIAANRDAALEIVPRLPGFTRDEYPFASTLEGGGGSWVGHIPSSQNSSQGGILKNFYQQNNIQPGMRFRVIIGE